MSTDPDIRPIVIDAPAKLNLTLKVLGRRDDGYHELESLVAFAPAAADRLTVTGSKTANARATGPFSRFIGKTNLVAQAMAATHTINPKVRLADIELQKNIPVAAGLGGGSADAAATLRALAQLNPAIADDIDWHDIAASLGADVAACLTNRACMMRGIGERITPLKNLPSLYAVLVNPQIIPPPDKTARVFKKLNAPNLDTQAHNPAHLKEAFELASRDVSPDALLQLLRALSNDLELPATAEMPQIAGVLAAIEKSPRCQLARMSGAGPTCFGLYPSMDAANTARDELKNAHPAWWVVATPLV